MRVYEILLDKNVQPIDYPKTVWLTVRMGKSAHLNENEPVEMWQQLQSLTQEETNVYQTI